MLTRHEHDNGVVTYQSPLLQGVGVRHAFSTRIGGVSQPPYDTLNLGVLEKNADTDGNVFIAENYRRLRRALDLERHVRVEVRQVHGADVWTPGANEAPVKLSDAPCADAIVTAQPGRMLVIRTADCVPILMASRDGRVVAAIHAGWRGVVAQVVAATFAEFDRRFRIGPDEWVAAIGPCISGEHFEVGTDVAIAFADVGLQQAIVAASATHPPEATDAEPAVGEGGAAALVAAFEGHAPERALTSPTGEDASSPGKPHIDLAEAVHHQLRHLGVPAEAIDRTPPEARCTYRNEAEFYSHRRDVTHRGKPDTGRMAAVIAARE